MAQTAFPILQGLHWHRNLQPQVYLCDAKMITAMEQKEKEQLRDALIRALKNSDYKVDIEEPNNLGLRQKYDGTDFLYVSGDSVKFGVYYGECTVKILGHVFSCEFGSGEESVENGDDEWLLEDKKFMKALCSAPGVIWGEQTDLESQSKVYSMANGLDGDLPAYWCEDDEIPKDVDSFDSCDDVWETITVLLAGGETEEEECSLGCVDVYDLYCVLEEKGLLYKTPEITSDFIREEVPSLYEDIVEQLCSSYTPQEEGGDMVGFTLPNTEYFFDSVLG